MNTWYEALPHLGDFINKVGFPVASWVLSIFILYKLGYKVGSKLWSKFEPMVDAHFDLVRTMKDNLSKQTDIMSRTNSIIEIKFDEQNEILSSHSEKLNEISINQIQHMKDHGIIPMKAVGTNGIKR